MKQILIISGKGGTGKTTIAGAFIEHLQSKAFADCDVDAPNLHLIQRFDEKPSVGEFYGLPKAIIDQETCVKCGLCITHCVFDAIDENHQVDEYACEGCGVCAQICPNQSISMKDHVSGYLKLYQDERIFSTAQLKTGSGNSGLLVNKVKNELKNHAKQNDLCILDGSPGIGCPVIAGLTGVDMAVIVTEPSVSGLSDMKRIVELGRGLHIKMGVCVNKCDVNEEKTHEIKEKTHEYGLHWLGTIPFDVKIAKALSHQKSLLNESIQKVIERTLDVLEGDNQYESTTKTH